MTLYGAFEITVIAAFGGWALWHTATRVFKLKLGRQSASRGGCGSGCGGCGTASKGSCSTGGSRIVAPPAPYRRP